MYSLPGMRRRLVIFGAAMIIFQMTAYLLLGPDSLSFWGYLAISVVVVATILPFYAAGTAQRWKADAERERNADRSG